MGWKKAAAALLAVCMLLLTFAACSRGPSYALVINGSKVGEEVYRYYLAQVQKDPAYRETKDVRSAAAELCSRYVAGNELIAKYGVTLSAADKVTASAKLKGTWQYFSDFYESQSVSKQTVSAMIEYEMLLEGVSLALFQAQGDDAQTQKVAENYFNQHYVGVKMLYASFTDENGQPVSEKAKDALVKKFTAMRSVVRKGGTMAAAAEQYPDAAVRGDSAETVICAEDAAYPTGMFENVRQMETGSTQVFKFESMIYLIQKTDMSKAKDIYFERYKKTCMIRIKQEETEKMINALAQSYKIVYNI